jgi:hypothetical protein
MSRHQLRAEKNRLLRLVVNNDENKVQVNNDENNVQVNNDENNVQVNNDENKTQVNNEFISSIWETQKTSDIFQIKSHGLPIGQLSNMGIAKLFSYGKHKESLLTVSNGQIEETYWKDFLFVACGIDTLNYGKYLTLGSSCFFTIKATLNNLNSSELYFQPPCHLKDGYLGTGLIGNILCYAIHKERSIRIYNIIGDPIINRGIIKIQFNLFGNLCNKTS